MLESCTDHANILYNTEQTSCKRGSKLQEEFYILVGLNFHIFSHILQNVK